MGLLEIPCDVFADIGHLLEFKDIHALLSCGCCRLTSNLLAFLDHFVWKLEPLQKFPFWVFNFTRLRQLSISTIIDTLVQPIRLNGHVPLPSKAIPGLTNLSLNFWQSFAILGNESTPSSLLELFPNLTFLELNGSTRPLNYSSFVGLPPGLKILKLRAFIRDSKRFSKLPYNIFNILPSALEHLELDSMIVNAGEDSYGDLKFPTHLRYFSISAFENTCALKHLPPHLEVFYALINGVDHNSYKLYSSQLPRSLQRFKLYLQLGVPLEIVYDMPLPPNLQVFNCRTKLPTTEMLPNLPSSLTEVPSSWCLHLPNLFDFFPRIAKLEQNWNGEFIPRETITAIPTLAKNLSLLHLPFIPAHMFVPFESLPSTITDLKFTFTKDAQVQNLPPNLIHLESSGSYQSNTFSPSEESWRILGVRHGKLLQRLGFSGLFVQSFAILEPFTSLTELTCKNCPLKALWGQEKKEEVERLPKSLTNLIVSSQDSSFPASSLVFLKRLNRMTSITISVPLSNELEQDMSDYYANLPPNLTSLSTSLITGIPSNAFSRLPSTLRTLLIFAQSESNDGNQALFITNDHFKNLPPSLTNLTIFGGHLITSSLFDIIRPSIPYVTLPNRPQHGTSDTREERLKIYNSQPLWESYHHDD
jgi:hypothetical protein